MNGFGSILKDYLNYYKITQTDFADRLGISQKHMNEILNGNAKMSQDLMIAISLLTDIDVKLIFSIEFKKDLYNNLLDKFSSDKEINKFLNSFHIKEMNEKHWLILRDKTSTAQNAVDLLKFLKVKDFDIYKSYADKRILYKKYNDADQKKIYLWIRHCDDIVSNVNIGEYDSNRLDELFSELKEESLRKFDKNRLIELLNKYGIILCIEDALKGTKIRGCSKVKERNPVIYLTTYFKEKSSFYFTLYHELSHIKTNYNRIINKLIFDESDEKKADLFALDKMISGEVWEQIIDNYDDRLNIAKENKIPLCFLVSRLAREKYIAYNSKEYNDNIERINLE